MDKHIYEQRSERHSATEIEHALWSPRLDLVALSSPKGEVTLQRIFWKRAWHVLSPDNADDAKVQAMAWAPSGTFLAVCYASGLVRYYEIEGSAILHEFHVDTNRHGQVHCMQWKEATESYRALGEEVWQSRNAEFAPPLPKVVSSRRRDETGLSGPAGTGAGHSGKKATEPLPSRITPSTEFNLLALGTERGEVLFFAYGMYLIGRVSMATYFVDGPPDANLKLCSLELSDDLTKLIVVGAIEDGQMMYTVLAIDGFTDWLGALQAVCCKQAQVTSSLLCMSETVQSMQDAWEDILFELELKFSKYAKAKFMVDGADATVGDDLLNMIALGTASAELENFLLTDLGEKGLKAFLDSLEQTFGSLLKIVAETLLPAAHATFYHVVDLQRMIKYHSRKEVSEGYSMSDLERAVANTGSLVLKIQEFRGAIMESLIDVRRFFAWLQTIMRIVTEATGASKTNKSKVDLGLEERQSCEDRNLVIQFIKDNFLEPWKESFSQASGVEAGASSGEAHERPRFKLESVGQYLKNEPLRLLAEMTEWDSFLATDRSEKLLSEHPTLLFQRNASLSLIQVFLLTKNAIETGLSGLETVLPGSVNLVKSQTVDVVNPVNLASIPCVSDAPDLSEKNAKESFRLIFQLDQEHLMLYSVDQETGEISHCARLAWPSMASLSCISADFYGSKNLILLLKSSTSNSPGQEASCFLSLLDLKHLGWEASRSRRSSYTGEKDVSLHWQAQLIPNASISSVFASWTRKVALLLFDCRTRLRLVDLDPKSQGDSSLSVNDAMDLSK